MATGDTRDMRRRLRSLIPGGWFAGGTPFRDVVLGGLADALAWVYGQSLIVKAQSRLKTTTGFMLDIAGYDLLGLRVRRRVGQTDDTFRSRVLREIFRERVTRAGMIGALTDLTGHVPSVFEPWNTSDTGGYGQGALAYGVAGAYGSMQLPAQAFLKVTRTAPAGIPLIAGYGSSVGGYGKGRESYVGPDTAAIGVTVQDVYDTINVTRPTGSVMWTAIA